MHWTWGRPAPGRTTTEGKRTPMIIASLDDAAQAIAALQRQIRRLEARMQAFEAAAADPAAIVAAFDRMLEQQLAGLETSLIDEGALFEDERPVRAVSPRR